MRTHTRATGFEQNLAWAGGRALEDDGGIGSVHCLKHLGSAMQHSARALHAERCATREQRVLMLLRAHHRVVARAVLARARFLGGLDILFAKFSPNKNKIK